MIKENIPNLFIVGAMKSGTTSLHQYLSEHPEIFMSTPKEPSYFVQEDELLKIWPKMKNESFWMSREEYLKLFKMSGNAKVIGESSTNYTKLDVITGVPDRLFEFNSKAKIIYIMRDPIKRTISHYWHMVQDHDEVRKPLIAIQNDPQFTAVSFYAKQLKPYITLFGRENVMTLTFEEMMLEPNNQLKKILKWLEVNDEILPANLGEKYHGTPIDITKARGVGTLRKFKRTAVWKQVHSYFPKSVKKVARKLAEKEVKKVSDDELIDVIEYLRPIQLKQTKKLEKLLGRNFAEWKFLNNTQIEIS